MDVGSPLDLYAAAFLNVSLENKCQLIGLDILLLRIPILLALAALQDLGFLPLPAQP